MRNTAVFGLKRDRSHISKNNREIVAAVMEQIEAAGIWLPEQEVTKYFYRRKPHYRSRIEKELQPKPKMQDKDSQTQKEQGAGSQ